jgi:hypothetical protein
MKILSIVKRYFVHIGSLVAVSVFVISLPGCAMTQQQLISSGVQALGSAYGSYVLTKYAASPNYLANYQAIVPKIYHVMQGPTGGGMTPADFHLLIGQIKVNTTPDAKQAAALGLLSSVTSSFVQYNGGTTPTADGSLADAEAKQLAQGLAAAYGVATGQNWTPDFNAATPPVSVTAVTK